MATNASVGSRVVSARFQPSHNRRSFAANCRLSIRRWEVRARKASFAGYLRKQFDTLQKEILIANERLAKACGSSTLYFDARLAGRFSVRIFARALSSDWIVCAVTI